MFFRAGFVSNSSSTAYTVLLPYDFDPEEVDLSPYQDLMDDQEVDKETVMQALKDLVRHKELWYEQYLDAHLVVMEAIQKYVIASADVSSDCGQIQVADINTVRKILGV